jgi:hypothetical protein
MIDYRTTNVSEGGSLTYRLAGKDRCPPNAVVSAHVD